MHFDKERNILFAGDDRGKFTVLKYATGRGLILLTRAQASAKLGHGATRD